MHQLQERRTVLAFVEKKGISTAKVLLKFKLDADFKVCRSKLSIIKMEPILFVFFPQSTKLHALSMYSGALLIDQLFPCCSCIPC